MFLLTFGAIAAVIAAAAIRSLRVNRVATIASKARDEAKLRRMARYRASYRNQVGGPADIRSDYVAHDELTCAADRVERYKSALAEMRENDGLDQ